GRPVAVGREGPGLDRGRREPRLVVRSERRELLVVAADGRQGQRVGEARERVLGRRAVGALGRAAREPREPLVAEVVRRRDPYLAVADDPEAERRVLDERRLVHLRVREAREAGALRY